VSRPQKFVVDISFDFSMVALLALGWGTVAAVAAR
jgi:hypothetical protein